MNKIDYTGQKFNKWTVIKFAFIKSKHTYWNCKCSCGTVKNVSICNLKGNLSLSCGCLIKEKNKKRRDCSLIKTRFYYIWAGMKDRCLNKKNKSYKYYGERKIKVCNEWLKFKNFRNDMYKSYLEHVKRFGEKETQIERKNNNENYNLLNCKWATIKEQANNKRSNHKITFKGKTMNLSEWAKEIKIDQKVLGGRLIRRKWSIERALTQKCKKKI